jgi:hypothetical protein
MLRNLSYYPYTAGFLWVQLFYVYAFIRRARYWFLSLLILLLSCAASDSLRDFSFLRYWLLCSEA